VHFLVKHNRNLQNALYALIHNSNETSRSLRRRDFLDDKNDYKPSIWIMLHAVIHTLIHTWNKALDPIRSLNVAKKTGNVYNRISGEMNESRVSTEW